MLVEINLIVSKNIVTKHISEKQSLELLKLFIGKTLLITGGTGTFSNAVMKRFLNTDKKEIRIFSRGEKKQDDMQKLYKNDKLKFYSGDVRAILA